MENIKQITIKFNNQDDTGEFNISMFVDVSRMQRDGIFDVFNEIVAHGYDLNNARIIYGPDVFHDGLEMLFPEQVENDAIILDYWVSELPEGKTFSHGFPDYVKFDWFYLYSL